MESKEIQLIKQEMDTIQNLFLNTIKIIPSFDITNKNILPYGLKPHTRSVSWIVEQVITQQTKYHKKKLGLEEVEIDMPDTCLHDCIIHRKEKKYYVNIKITNVAGNKNKNDIAAVEKLYMQYMSNPTYRLIYVVFGFQFQNINISFMKNSISVFSPQFLPIYINPRNDKIQAYYKTPMEIRSRKKFLDLLKNKSKSISL